MTAPSRDDSYMVRRGSWAAISDAPFTAQEPQGRQTFHWKRGGGGVQAPSSGHPFDGRDRATSPPDRPAPFPTVRGRDPPDREREPYLALRERTDDQRLPLPVCGRAPGRAVLRRERGRRPRREPLSRPRAPPVPLLVRGRATDLGDGREPGGPQGAHRNGGP